MAKSLSNIQTEDQETDGMMNKWINCLGGHNQWGTMVLAVLTTRLLDQYSVQKNQSNILHDYNQSSSHLHMTM